MELDFGRTGLRENPRWRDGGQRTEDGSEELRVLGRISRCRSYHARMKTSCVLSFVCGVAVMLTFSAVGQSPNPVAHHVYELRLYHVNEGKMDALKARFGDHTDAIFRRHNMKSIGYWQPEDGQESQTLFVYILEHPSREAAEKNWAAFHDDPEWKKVKEESEKNGPLVERIDHYFMDPTSYSKLN